MTKIILTKEQKTHRTIITKTYNEQGQIVKSEEYTQSHKTGRETIRVKNQEHQFSTDEKKFSFSEIVNLYQKAGYFKVEIEN